MNNRLIRHFLLSSTKCETKPLKGRSFQQCTYTGLYVNIEYGDLENGDLESRTQKMGSNCRKERIEEEIIKVIAPKNCREMRINLICFFEKC